MKRRLPKASPTKWRSKFRMLQTVSMYYSDLLTVFLVIGNAEDKWGDDLVMKSVRCERWLSKTTTCFLIMIYKGIFDKNDALLKVLQNKLMWNDRD